MDALKLLEDDHRKVGKLLEELESTSEESVDRRQELFSRLKREMEIHEAIEEEIFYPALKEHPKAKEVVLEGYEEHNVVNRLMGELSRVSNDDERWGAKLSVMKENVEHHIEEEEGEMFDKARTIFAADDLAALGERMARRKEELVKSS